MAVAKRTPAPAQPQAGPPPRPVHRPHPRAKSRRGAWRSATRPAEALLGQPGQALAPTARTPSAEAGQEDHGAGGVEELPLTAIPQAAARRPGTRGRGVAPGEAGQPRSGRKASSPAGPRRARATSASRETKCLPAGPPRWGRLFGASSSMSGLPARRWTSPASARTRPQPGRVRETGHAPARRQVAEPELSSGKVLQPEERPSSRSPRQGGRAPDLRPPPRGAGRRGPHPRKRRECFQS